MCDFQCLNANQPTDVSFTYGSSSSVPTDKYRLVLAFYNLEMKLCAAGPVSSEQSEAKPLASVKFNQGNLSMSNPGLGLQYVGYVLTTSNGDNQGCITATTKTTQVGLNPLTTTPTPSSMTIPIFPPPGPWMVNAALITAGVLGIVLLIVFLLWRRYRL